jgi:hypothetical protein
MALRRTYRAPQPTTRAVLLTSLLPRSERKGKQLQSVNNVLHNAPARDRLVPSRSLGGQEFPLVRNRLDATSPPRKRISRWNKGATVTRGTVVRVGAPNGTPILRGLGRGYGRKRT